MPAAPFVGAVTTRAACRVLLIDRHGPEIDPVHGRERVGHGFFHAGENGASYLQGASLDRQAAREFAALPHAALDAGFHGRVYAVEPGRHLRLRPAAEFVLRHELRDAEAGGAGACEQVGGTLERVRQNRPCIVGIVAADLGLVADETAADGKIRRFEQRFAGCILGTERQRIGMRRQAPVPCPDDVPLGDEFDAVCVAEREALRCVAGLQRGLACIRVKAGRLVTHQAKDHRPVGVVAFAGQCQGRIENRLHPADPRDGAGAGQVIDETFRRGHGAHGMRTGGADA